MLPSVRSAFARVCNAGQEILTWCKPNVINPGDPRLISATEFCLLGYYNVTGQREMAHYNFAPTDRRHNFQLFDACTRKYFHLSDNTVLCPYQKPYSLYSWLVTKFSPPGATVLDGFSGSGTGVIACILSNRNCLVVEVNKRCAKGILIRLLTDISKTLEREMSKQGKGKAKESQLNEDIEVSGDHGLEEQEKLDEEGIVEEATTQQMTHETWQPMPGLISKPAEESNSVGEAEGAAQQLGANIPVPPKQQKETIAPVVAFLVSVVVPTNSAHGVLFGAPDSSQEFREAEDPLSGASAPA
ncbi:hypothetical protein CBR_g23642 [Chara braunii]|uniref:DNA methylase N-4/N-6 domain-containing protein n=1 Tax=Chara braunii TaxID=69332 RepID=A0A388L4Z2_CHABU|nr:hypothetical protein CBR_g23642 [Chara braunii]|eukprot:GBG77312.1 hypothetical protein CBR_g23642 [Chara braunii]